MASYKVEFAAGVRKDFRKIPKRDAQRILERIQKLADDPRPPDSKKLAGDGSYRIRIGMYRVIYDVYDGRLVILVLRVGNRKDVYRK